MPIQEPPLSADDTRPGAALGPIEVPFERRDVRGPASRGTGEPAAGGSAEPPVAPRPVIKRAPLTTVYDDLWDEPAARSGCGNPLLVLFSVVATAVMVLAIVGLAGLAGYRDGVNDSATRAAQTRVAVLSTQRSAITADLQVGNWEILLARCQYVATLVPADSAAAACIQTATGALNAPTGTTPPTAVPTSTPTPPSNAVKTGSPAVPPPTTDARAQLPGLITQAQAQIKIGELDNLEKARDLLEAVRTVDPLYEQRQVEPALCGVYERLGTIYDSVGRLSEMVIVINKALNMTCRLNRTDWAFTVNAAQLYLDAKAYLDAGNLKDAVRVYRELMRIAPGYQNTKDLACQAFKQAGDSAATASYGCN
jgi:tetratricopeptide (TPR) repeat protein